MTREGARKRAELRKIECTDVQKGVPPVNRGLVRKPVPLHRQGCSHLPGGEIPGGRGHDGREKGPVPLPSSFMVRRSEEQRAAPG